LSGAVGSETGFHTWEAVADEAVGQRLAAIAHTMTKFTFLKIEQNLILKNGQ
jgi:hypothetical protein